MSIPYSIEADGTIFICLVSSRKHNDRFVLPKGGIEREENGRQAAIRELWEEAGLRPVKAQKTQIEGNVSTISDHKSHKTSSVSDPEADGFVPRAVYEAHEVLVRKGDAESELDDWPEKEERIRRWATFQEAVELIRWRKDIHQLLLQSSLSPNA